MGQVRSSITHDLSILPDSGFDTLSPGTAVGDSFNRSVRQYRKAFPSHSTLENLNPADTATRYTDTSDIEIGDPSAALDDVKELLQWIRKQLHK